MKHCNRTLHNELISIIVFLFLALSFGNANAENPEKGKPVIKEIKYHTQEWRGFTNRDGTGLYHDIMERIFGLEKLQVKTSYAPFRRTIKNVQAGVADITGGVADIPKRTIRSRYPIWAGHKSVLFKKSYLNQWKGQETIVQNTNLAISPPHLLEEDNIHVPEARNRQNAIKMLLTGRVRYYIDTSAIIEDLMYGTKDGLAFEEGLSADVIKGVNWDDYVVREIISLYWYMVFPDTQRGHYIRDIYDNGFRSLHASGELKRIYKKWGMEQVLIKELPVVE